MRTSLVLIILQLVAVRGDARLRRDIDEPQLGVARREFYGRQNNGGAIASEICGFLGGEISSCHICQLSYIIFMSKSLRWC
jgi:hypothetical protein